MFSSIMPTLSIYSGFDILFKLLKNFWYSVSRIIWLVSLSIHVSPSLLEIEWEMGHSGFPVNSVKPDSLGLFCMSNDALLEIVIKTFILYYALVEISWVIKFSSG